jgi:hypothetical protein
MKKTMIPKMKRMMMSPKMMINRRKSKNHKIMVRVKK